MSRMILKKMPYSLARLLALVLILIEIVPARGIELFLPPRFRSEGRITMTYESAKQSVEHKLVFTELIDRTTSRAKISIGYVSHKPNEYFTKAKSPTILVDEHGLCKKISDFHSFVPELDWFIKLTYEDAMIDEFQKSSQYHNVGPSGLLGLHIDQMKSIPQKLDADSKRIYRNIPCMVASHSYKRSNNVPDAKFEVFIPINGSIFGESRLTWFALKETAKGCTSKGTDAKKFDVSFTIDYFNIDIIDGNQHKIDRMEQDFNLPMGKGCSEFLPMVMLPEPKQGSFIIGFTHKSSLNNIMLAYDHNGGYLRKDVIDQRVSIWDLNEDLMYNIDPHAVQLMTSDAVKDVATFRTCSVMKVVDEGLIPAIKPYKTVGKSLDIVEILGASVLGYIGRGTVRGIPCSIYESVIKELPLIFNLASSPVTQRDGIDYIIQYYLLTRDIKPKNSDEEVGYIIEDEDFWPLRIVLYERDKDNQVITEVDGLEVTDFFWGLNGYPRKASEMFMVSDCFDEEEEQTRVSLALYFDRVHSGSAKADDRIVLAQNKFKLEFDIIDHLIGNIFKISRLYLTEFELLLRPHHVLADFVISDRSRSDIVLSYHGPGYLARPDAYIDNRVVLYGLEEEKCLSAGSVIQGVAMGLWCPPNGNDGASTSCIIVFNENDAAIISANPNQEHQLEPPCRIYRYASAEHTKKANVNWDERKKVLLNAKYQFNAYGANNTTDTFDAEIQSVEITQAVRLIVIEHFKFTLNKTETVEDAKPETKPQLTRSFDKMPYRNVGDCARMCSLDPDCRSYSFCEKASGYDRCIISSLDLRLSNVKDVILQTSWSDTTLKVKSDHSSDIYELALDKECSLYERNFLDMFKQTDEYVQLNAQIARQMPTSKSASQCAKQATDLEAMFNDRHVAMFAYCPQSNVCILDEDLFKSVPNQTLDDSTDSSNFDASKISQEVSCAIYRRLYQDYFHVSAKIFKRSSVEQLELATNTVEECARACWNRFGQVCASFDYCSPSVCLINQHRLDDGDSHELESQAECLHYERDLRLDELRREHLIGRHELLSFTPSGMTFGKFMLNSVLFALVLGAFVSGLFVGRLVNDRLDTSSISGQSNLVKDTARGRSRSGPRPSIMNFASFCRHFGSMSEPSDRMNNGQRVSGFESEAYDGNSISLEVIEPNSGTNHYED